MSFHRVSLIIAILVFLCGCDRFLNKAPSLSYRVRVLDVDKQQFDIEMRIHGQAHGILNLQAHVFQGFTALDDFRATHATGEELKVVLEDKTGTHKRNTYRLKVLNHLPKGDIKITYRARVGLKMHEKHGVESKYTYGYMDERFALVSGRSLFVLPDETVDSIRIRFEMPDGWTVSSPWDEFDGWLIPKFASGHIKEELANTNLALGLLEHRNEKIGDTDVTVAVFEGWEPAIKDELHQNAIMLYKFVLGLFGGDGNGNYVFNFVPMHKDGYMFQTTHFSTSQGAEMDPAIPERWLESAEKLIDRWVRLPPFRMTYESQDDYWVVDGVRRYYAIKACDELGLADGKYYLETERKKFMRALADGHAENLFFVINDHVTDRSDVAVRDVRKLFVNHTKALRHKREGIAPSVVAFLDQAIQNFTQRRYEFADVLKFEYSKRRRLNLLADIESVVGDDLSRDLGPFLHDLHKIPVENDMITQAHNPPPSWIEEPGSTSLDTLRILFTGNTYGFLEHCGCKVNQNGGVARRATVVSEVRKQFPDALLFDLGNAFTKDIYRMTDFDTGELRLYLRSLGLMGYDVANVAFFELYHGGDYFLDMTWTGATPFLCANVLKDGKPIGLPHMTVRAGRFNVGVIGLFQRFPGSRKDDALVFQYRTRGLKFVDPIEALRTYLPIVSRENDLVIVVGALSPDFIRDKLTAIDGIDIVLSTESTWGTLVATDRGITFVDQDLSGFQGDLLNIYAKSGLYSISMMDFYVDKGGRIVGGRRKSFPLSDDIEDDHRIRNEIDGFYTRTVAIDTDIRPLFDWQVRNHIDYVGVEKCQNCHPDQHTQWQLTRHAFAMNTLLDARRHYQPKCVVCHVTGAGYETGYQMGDLTHPLLNVQCEACHGPGAKHVGDPFRVDMLRTPSIELCVSCHDQQHSEFNLEKYYPKVTH